MFRSPPSLAIPTTLSKDGWGHRLGKWGVGGQRRGRVGIQRRH